MSDKTHDSLRLSCNPQDIFMWYEGEIDKLKSEIAQLKSQQKELSDTEKAFQIGGQSGFPASTNQPIDLQQKEQFSREDMWEGWFQSGKRYYDTRANFEVFNEWLTEYLNSKNKIRNADLGDTL